MALSWTLSKPVLQTSWFFHTGPCPTSNGSNPNRLYYPECCPVLHWSWPCPACRAGEMTSEVGGTRFQGAQRWPPLKTENSSDLTNYFSKRAQFNKMIKIFSKKIFLDLQGGPPCSRTFTDQTSHHSSRCQLSLVKVVSRILGETVRVDLPRVLSRLCKYKFCRMQNWLFLE